MPEEQHRDFEEACTLGIECLRLAACSEQDLAFLPMARALIFYSSTRVGLGLGFEHGHGFISARRPYSIMSSCHAEWSPPWFIKVRGIQCGAVAGAEKISVVAGAMSEKMLKDLTKEGGKIALGSDYSICVPTNAATHTSKKQSHTEVMFDSDLCCAAVSAAGMMVDIGLSGTVFTRDERNKRCYGPEASPETILGGAVLPPPEMEKLAKEIEKASKRALISSFEPSNASEF